MRRLRFVCGVLLTGGLIAGAFLIGRKSVPLPPDDRTGDAVLTVARPAGSSDTDWQRKIETHAVLLRDPGLIRRVLGPNLPVHKTYWSQIHQKDPTVPVADALRNALTVRIVPGTSLITVSVSAHPPRDATLIVNTLCDEYFKQCRERISEQHAQRLKELRTDQQSLEGDLNQLAEWRKHREAFHSSEKLHNRMVERYDRLQAEVNDASRRVLAAKSVHQAALAARKEGRVPAVVEAEAARSPDVAQLRQELLRIQVARLETQPARTAGATLPNTAPTGDGLASREAACAALLEQAANRARQLAWDAEIERARSRLDEAMAAIDILGHSLSQTDNELGRAGFSPWNFRTFNEKESVLRAKLADVEDRMREHNRSVQNPDAGISYVRKASVSP